MLSWMRRSTQPPKIAGVTQNALRPSTTATAYSRQGCTDVVGQKRSEGVNVLGIAESGKWCAEKEVEYDKE